MSIKLLALLGMLVALAACGSGSSSSQINPDQARAFFYGAAHEPSQERCESATPCP